MMRIALRLGAVTAVLALSVTAVSAQIPPSSTKWRGELADGTQIDEEWLIWFIAQHRQAVANRRREPEVKREDYWQPLRGSALSRVNFRGIARQAEARWPVQGSRPDALDLLDLSHCGLVDADLADLQLSGVDFEDTNLTRAILGGTRAAGMSWGSLENSDLTDAILDRYNFFEVRADRAYFFGTMLAGTHFTRVSLIRAAFIGKTNLDGAKFDRSDLTGATFSTASLRYADFSGVVITDAIFGNTDGGADLTGVNWEPRGIPNLAGLALSRNLELLTYQHIETPLVQLRKALMEAGLRETERKVNYALQRARIDHIWNRTKKGDRR